MLNISSLSCIFQTFSILPCFSVTWLNAKYQYFDIKAVVWIMTHRGRTCRWTLTLADLTMMMRSAKLYSLDIWNLTRNRTATLKFCLLFSELLLDSCPGDFPAHREMLMVQKRTDRWAIIEYAALNGKAGGAGGEGFVHRGQVAEHWRVGGVSVRRLSGL